MLARVKQLPLTDEIQDFFESLFHPYQNLKTVCISVRSEKLKVREGLLEELECMSLLGFA